MTKVVDDKKMQSLKRILYCAENDMLSYEGRLRNYDGKYCSIGCLFDDALIYHLERTVAPGRTMHYLFESYPGLTVDTGLSRDEAQEIQSFHDNFLMYFHYPHHVKSTFIEKVKFWIKSGGKIV